MCTAISFKTRDHYCGRNLDLEYSFNESVVVMPRRFPLALRSMPALQTHLAMIGTATVIDGFPLYYDATNESGLSIAALNFPGNAHDTPANHAKSNIAPFELIPGLLARCASAAQARVLAERPERAGGGAATPPGAAEERRAQRPGPFSLLGKKLFLRSFYFSRWDRPVHTFKLFLMS